MPTQQRHTSQDRGIAPSLPRPADQPQLGSSLGRWFVWSAVAALSAGAIWTVAISLSSVPPDISLDDQQATPAIDDSRTARAGASSTPVKDGIHANRSERADPIVATAAIPGLAERETLHSVADQVRYVRPGSDEWSTEALGAEAAARLDAIGRQMGHADRDKPWPTAIPLASGFQCRSLRPVGDVSFRDETFQVRQTDRARVAGQSASAKYFGATGLRDALAELATPFTDGSPIHLKFKIVRVEETAHGVTTTAYYQADAMSSSGRIQQNATWRCRWLRQPDRASLSLASIEVDDFAEVAARSPETLFVDCTQSVLGGNACYRDQFSYGNEYWQTRLDGSFGIDVAGLEGLAVGDVNGDGLDDVYVCQTGGLPNRLFVQNADGTATDRAASAGVDWQDLSRSALMVDLDNDDDQDLVVALRYEVLFLANDGSGRFSLEDSWANTADLFSLAAADYDADGDLDVYVCVRNDTNSAFRHGALGTPIPYHDANNGAANALLENRGDWTFVDVTRGVGLDENNRRFSYAATWDDYDNDGDQDLYVANDHGRNNLYQNQGGTFRDVAAATGVEDMAAGMSASWGDFNRDGWMDMYVSNMFSSAGGRVTYQRQFHDQAADQTRAHYQRHTRGNTLFAADGRGGFRDESEPAQVTMGRWAWGSIFWDFNNDGWQDIYVANGFITGPSTDDL